MWLPLLGNDERCRLIAVVIRDSLLIQTQLYRSLYRGNPLGPCFLFRKGPVTSLDYACDWAEEHDIPIEMIAFYHALIGKKRKHEIKEKLAQGEIHLLFCTDAVGMVSFGM